VFDILNPMPAFKVFANIQEFDDYLWGEVKKWMPKLVTNDKRRWPKIAISIDTYIKQGFPLDSHYGVREASKKHLLKNTR
jgi:hypothetical protein